MKIVIGASPSNDERQQLLRGALRNLFVDLAEDRQRAMFQQRVLEKVELLDGVERLFAIHAMPGRTHDRLLLKSWNGRHGTGNAGQLRH